MTSRLRMFGFLLVVAESGLAGFGLAGCDQVVATDAGTSSPIDAAIVDASTSDGPTADGGAADGGATDGGATDGGPMDGGALESVGTIAGSCGLLDDELVSAEPYYVENEVTFEEGFSLAQKDRLSAGAQEILLEGTAGGSSSYSEALAFEVLARCEGARLIKSETEIVYAVPMPGSITDILVEIMGQRIGVSVTRAVNATGRCTRLDTYSEAMAAELLGRKLAGVNESSALVSVEDAWTKQILFIFADTATHAASLMNAWGGLDPSLRADTILYVSVSEGMDEFIYFEDRCGP